MDPNFEIRKLPPSVFRRLSEILDYDESWKRLMSIIPKQLSAATFVADVKPDNLPKYHSEHFKSIQEGGVKYQRSCTGILIEEWGTSGKVRPRLGHLKYLLIKAELFRAADYVATLLNEPLPVRPATGPAAPIHVDLSSPVLRQSPVVPRTEPVKINNVENAIYAIQKQSQEPVHPVKVIPQIVVSEIEAKRDQLFNPPLVVQIDKHKPTAEMSSNSEDMIPHLSILLQESGESQSEVSTSSEIIPDISGLLRDREDVASTTSSISNDNESSPPFIPAFSIIMPGTSNSVQEDDPIPAFSQLIDLQKEDSTVDEELIPNLSALTIKSDPELYPDFDDLMAGNSQSQVLIPEVVSNITKPPSPLPSLSIETELPHFTYSDLVAATNNFKNVPFTSLNWEGRLLGSGGYGSVFLATGLLDRLLAVKKISLEGTKEGTDRDLVTTQFKNEILFLSQYKHKYLVSLVGYSCDGPAYCLVYDYVPGGNLENLLKKNPREFMWPHRLIFAYRAATAINYLHTSTSKPLIHRDIKSANILIDVDFIPKLCDFGLVKLLPHRKAGLQTAPLGTSAYMSPEYHRGNVSTKIDCYSFGVVLLELLSSKPVIDENREGHDLVTFVEQECEHSIDPLLDPRIGRWELKGIDFSMKLFKLALKCIEPSVSNRPEIIEVADELANMVREMFR